MRDKFLLILLILFFMQNIYTLKLITIYKEKRIELRKIEHFLVYKELVLRLKERELKNNGDSKE